MTEKQNSLPNIPKSWVWTKLGSVCTTASGGTPSRKNQSYYTGDIPWLKSGELNNQIINSTGEHITKEAVLYSATKIFPKGTLVIALYGATTGKLGILGLDSATNQAVCAIFPYDGISRNFVFWYLTYYRNKLLTNRYGGAQPNISQQILKTVPFPIVPLREQDRIVGKLEELSTKLDAGVNSLQKVKAQLQLYRQAVLKHAFEGKFTQEWRRTHKNTIEHASVLLERIRTEQNERNNSKYRELPTVDTSNLPELPESWTWTRIGQIGEVVTGRTPKKSNPDYYSNDYPFFKPADLNSGFYVKSSVDKLSKEGINHARLLPEKSVLVTCIGATIGKTGFIRVQGASNQQINAIITYKHILPEFVYFYCISHQFQKEIIENSSSTTLPIINKNKFQNLPLALPSFVEQTKIAEEIETRFSVATEIEKVTKQSLLQSERLRQSLLKSAFEGRLVPQDPSDEPAEKLLERIREEKKQRDAKKKVKRGRSKRVQVELSRYGK